MDDLFSRLLAACAAMILAATSIGVIVNTPSGPSASGIAGVGPTEIA